MNSSANPSRVLRIASANIATAALRFPMRSAAQVHARCNADL
jgi:hypothetical protein